MLSVPRASAGFSAARGAAYLVAAGICFTGMGAMIRHVAEAHGLHPFEMGFFRYLFALLILAPWWLAARRSLPRPRHFPYLLRSAAELVAVMAWFLGVTLVPLADFTAVSFTSILFAVAIAALFLGERVGPRRWFAVVAGFLGALVVLRPAAGISAATLVPLVAAVAVAVSRIAAKLLVRTERPEAIAFYMAVYTTPLTLVPALFVWTTPSVGALLWLAAIAVIGSIGTVFLAKAYGLADVSVLAPFDFFQIPVAALIGLAAFGQRPDATTWIGAALIAGAALYATYREAALRAAALTRGPTGAGDTPRRESSP